MESSAAKQQPMAGGSMATAEQMYLRTELELRRERLHEALHLRAPDASLSELLTAVDTALSRIDQGTFGLCETCHDSIEAERLLADPLVRFCLDHLTNAEQRALESDLSLAEARPGPSWLGRALPLSTCRHGERRLLRSFRNRGRAALYAGRCFRQGCCRVNAHEPPSCNVPQPRRSRSPARSHGGRRQPHFLREHSRGTIRDSRRRTSCPRWFGGVCQRGPPSRASHPW